ncbi:MAG: hypothetical protein RL456_1955 [Pseudomonadota bacterium]|jgi:hypothetical protein
MPNTTTTPRWYVLDAGGRARLCADDVDATEAAAECDKAWPSAAPHRAVQLVEVAELDAMKAERDAVTAALGQLIATEILTLAPDVKPFKASDLVRRAVRNLDGRRSPARRRTAFWADVSYHFGLGSNCSAGLARWAGLDPETGQAAAPLTVVGDTDANAEKLFRSIVTHPKVVEAHAKQQAAAENIVRTAAKAIDIGALYYDPTKPHPEHVERAHGIKDTDQEGGA